MPRELRDNVEGGIFHIYARGNDRGLIYRDDADYLAYLGLLGRTIARTRWACLSYCLMPNHVHLLLETPSPNLSSGMQLLHGRYASRFNARHSRSGHVFQGRFGAGRIESDRHLRTVAGYIAQNPVEARLRSRPEDWPWSSYRGLIGDPVPSWLSLGRQRRLFDGA